MSKKDEGFDDVRDLPKAKMDGVLISIMGEPRVYDETAETTAELAARHNMSTAMMQRALRVGVRKGVIEQVWKRVLLSDGRHKPLPAYRPVTKDKVKSKAAL